MCKEFLYSRYVCKLAIKGHCDDVTQLGEALTSHGIINQRVLLNPNFLDRTLSSCGVALLPVVYMDTKAKNARRGGPCIEILFQLGVDMYSLITL